MKKNNTIFIAEAGVNHNGSIKKACKLIDIAANSGADFVKFQHTNPNLISTNAPISKDQSKLQKKKIKQKEFTKSFHLNWKKAYPILIKRSKKKKIKFLTSVFSSEDYNEVKKLKLKYIKISSGEIVNFPLLDNISRSKDTVFLSTGGSNINEIKRAIKILRTKYANKKIYLLHCVSAYPVPKKEINLNSISYLFDKTKLDIGYSDHALGYDHLFTSIGLGAKVIEKHFTINKKLKGPDHKISLSPKELKECISKIRNIESMMGKKNKIIQKSEKKNVNIIRQSIHTSKIINKNEILTSENIILMRPNGGIDSFQFKKIINKYKLKKKYKKEYPLKFKDLVKI